MREGSLFLRVRIGDRLFKTGDGHLQKGIKVVLSELERGSNTRFSVCDPLLEIGSHFQRISFQTGGILVPSELLPSTQDQPQLASSIPAIAPDPDMGGAIAPSPGGGQLATYPSSSQDEIAMGIVREGLKQGFSPNEPHFFAFFLACAEGESTFNHKAYNDEGGRFGVYGGRGLGQITHKGNYELIGKELGIPLAQNPALAFRPDISTYVLVRGIRVGWCSKGGIRKWLPTATSSLSTAYRKIQGGVWGARYQSFYTKWLPRVPALIAAAGGRAAPVAVAAPIQSPVSTPMPVANPLSQPTAIAASSPPVVENSFKGTEVIIEAGYSPHKMLAWHFIHTGTTVKKNLEGETADFEAQSVRWLLTQVPENRSLENTSFKELAETFAGSLNLDVKFDGKGSLIAHRDVTNLTPYQVLAQEAKTKGFTLQDDTKRSIVIQPYARVEITNFIVDEYTFISADFGDQAKAHSTAPDVGMGEPVASFNPSSGATIQAKENIALGTLKPGSGGATTGAAVSPVSAIAAPPKTGGDLPRPATAIRQGDKKEETEVLPSTRSSTDEGIEIKTGTKKVVTERGKITTTTTTTTVVTGANNIELSREVRVRTVTETRQGTITETSVTRDGQTTTSKTASNEVDAKVLRTEGSASDRPVEMDAFGLPRQVSGAIDLSDGRVEPSGLVDEKTAIEGFKSTLTLLMCDRTLKLVPGEVIGLSRKLFPDPYSREWRIREASFDFGSEVVTLTIYTPQAPPPEAAIAPISSPLSIPAMSVDANAGAVQQFAAPAGGWVAPAQGRTGDGVGMRSASRRHNGTDIANGAGTAIVAPSDGIIFTFTTGYGGGFGYSVVMRHAGDIFTRQAHCIAGSCPFQKGQQVKVGQRIAQMDNTGRSFGSHLHTEIRKGGEYGQVMVYSQVGVRFPPPYRSQYRY